MLAKLIDILPASLKADQNIRSICEALQPEFDQINQIINTKIFFSDLDNLDDITLDYLLGECNINKSVDGVFIRNRNDKINYLRNYIKLKQLKGTRDGVSYALDLFGVKSEISEWFENGQDPYYFDVKIDNGSGILTPEQIKLLQHFITEYKNERSWFKTHIVQSYESEIYAAVIAYKKISFNMQVQPFTVKNKR